MADIKMHCEIIWLKSFAIHDTEWLYYSACSRVNKQVTTFSHCLSIVNNFREKLPLKNMQPS